MAVMFGRPTPEPDPRQPPGNRAPGAILTARLMIEFADRESNNALVSLFLSHAWPTLRAQNQ